MFSALDTAHLEEASEPMPSFACFVTYAAGPDQRQAIHQQENRHFETYTDENGMLVIRGRLAPEVGAVLLRALEAAQEQLNRKADRETSTESSWGQKRADALALVAESALAGGLDPGTAGDRYRVEMIEGDLRFHSPHGWLIHDAPSRPSPHDLDIIDAPTVPWWTAEPLNLDWAMAVLRQ